MSLQELKRYEELDLDKFIKGDYDRYSLVTNSGKKVTITDVTESEFSARLTRSDGSIEIIRYSSSTCMPIGIEGYIDDYKIKVDKWVDKYALLPYLSPIKMYESEIEARRNSLPSDIYLVKLHVPEEMV